MYGGPKKTMGPGGKAKRANKVLKKSRTKMDNAVTLYNKGKTNKESSSATAQEFGQDQQIRSKGKENKAIKLKTRSEKIAKRKGLTYKGDAATGQFYVKAAGGSYKKAKKSDVVKYAAGGAKPNSGAVNMAKGIIKKAGMKVVSAAYGKKVIRKKK